jgi:hypothetical protein
MSIQNKIENEVLNNPKNIEDILINPDRVFANKISLCLHLLGGESDIISSVSSWKDSLSDAEVFRCIDLWIEGTLSEQKRTISHVEKWHNKQ